METIRNWWMALVAVLLCANFTSCGSDNEVPGGTEEPNTPNEFEIAIGFGGEISVSDSPLGRAVGNDLYAVQVYSKKTTGTADYAPYAYGLFDDIASLTLNVTEGYTYQFVASMVKDAKNKIKATDNKYGAPYGEKAISSDNKFVLSTTAGFDALGSGSALLVGATSACAMPNLDRYYGKAELTPSVTNKAVTIHMLRTVFGLKFVAKGLDQEGETVKIAISDAPAELNISYVEGSSEQATDEIIYTFKDVAAAYAAGTTAYTANVTLTITMNNVDVITKDITVTRNMLSTVTINEPNHNGQISITCEENAMTAGTNYEIDAEGNMTSGSNNN